MKSSMQLTLSIEDIKKIQLHFIVSTGRTGSTLLSAMFNMHKNLLSPVEEPFAFNLYFKYHDLKEWTSQKIDEYCYDFYLFSEGVLEQQFGTKKDLKDALEQYKSELDFYTTIKISYLCFFPERDKTNITTIIDKQLKFHDFIEKVAVFFPDSKFIILNRDPRDNSLVKMKRIIREKSKGFFQDQNKSNYWTLGLIWNRVYSLIYEKRKKIGEHRFLELKYEDLVANPEKELSRVADFTGFEFDPIMLQYHVQTKEKIEQANEMQDIKKQMFYLLHKSLTEKTNTDKVGFWKDNLSKNDANIIWNVCAQQAMKIGYKSESCDGKATRDKHYYRAYLNVAIQNILIPKIYYGLPFFIRYAIKKRKYGNKFKQNRYTSDKFKETTS
ncbi:MAG: sulfotransferase [Bacteroidetes bacterium]|nr:sulfotransferase [Bacteroidota bacterium]